MKENFTRFARHVYQHLNHYFLFVIILFSVGVVSIDALIIDPYNQKQAAIKLKNLQISKLAYPLIYDQNSPQVILTYGDARSNSILIDSRFLIKQSRLAYILKEVASNKIFICHEKACLEVKSKINIHLIPMEGTEGVADIAKRASIQTWLKRTGTY